MNKKINKSDARSAIDILRFHDVLGVETTKSLLEALEGEKGNNICLDIFKSLLIFSKQDKNDIETRVDFENEFNSALEYVHKNKISGDELLGDLNQDIKESLEDMNRELESNQEKIQKIILTIDTLQKNAIELGISKKDFNLYLSNKIAYRYWVEILGNTHHDGVFCSKTVDNTLETENFKKNFDILFDRILDVKENNHIDLFHFFAAYSAYGLSEDNIKEGFMLKGFKGFVKIFTGINTFADNDEIGYDIPKEFRKSFWYTLGGDVLSDISYTHSYLDDKQILIDIYSLNILKQSSNKNNFDIVENFKHLLSSIENKIDWRDNIFYKVLEEMVDLEINKFKNFLMKLFWDMGMGLINKLKVIVR